MPFDRLIGLVDRWAARTEHEVFAQTGAAGMRPEHMPFAPSLAPAAYREAFAAADLIVAHAGMGTILTALQMGKPLLVLPRHADRGETRNDHQIHTAQHFAQRELVTAALTDEQLTAALERIEDLSVPLLRIGDHATDELLGGLGGWLRDNGPRRAG